METKRVKVQSLDNSTNVAAQISRIQMDRDKIRAKLVELSLAESTDNLDLLANQIHDIQNNGAIQAEVKEGESYSIPKGYHNGSGVVKGVAGGGNYSLQAKTVIPTKRQQNISSDEGYYGLSSVTVEPIPETYQDVTSVTATSDDVLSGKVIVTSNGSIVPGTMLNYGAVNKNLDVNNTSYTISKGYHNGNGIVTIQLEEKNVKSDLQKALQRLPERERVLMVLYYQENMTMKEIGATLNMSESRVCQLHAQAIMKLKNIFSENRTSRLQQSIV